MLEDIDFTSTALAALLAVSPTVEMDAGGFDSSETWSLLQPEISSFTRVCVLDRAGFGKSERRPNPSYTSQEMVKDLHTLLLRAHIAGPFVSSLAILLGA